MFRQTVFPLAIVGSATGVVLLPVLSRHLRAGEDAAAMSTLNRGIELVLLLTVPAVLYADALARIFDLDPVAVGEAANFIRALSYWNLGFAITTVLGAALRAAGDTLTPLWTGLVTNVVNVALVYGLVFGQNERKAMSMSLVDRALRTDEFEEDVVSPAQDEEFVISHSDNVQATGFVEHLKLPHYVDFQSELEKLRAMRATAAAAAAAPVREAAE